MTDAPPIDLERYLDRIGLAAAPAATEDGLAAIQRAQRLAIPFENLDIPLGRGISLDPDAVFAKLVTARRGGYCFEQNQLFLRALIALGFAARPLIARVWLMATDVPGQTHTLNLVTLAGHEWIADAGFGGAYMPVMPLEADRVHRTDDGALHRLRRDAQFGWMLERDGGSATGWQRQYSFETAPAFASDFVQANHWIATAPESRFTGWRIAGIVLPGGHATLMERALSIRDASGSIERTLDTPDAWRHALAEIFGIRLTAAEVARIGLFDVGDIAA
ncbi:arylamine N-acetyltransferase family protein [Flavisphingomonas formosensis]|uniref:arylamine N-acetyltransferase family protein n=1 Tax=Flavisphingomonas formosensis TaxID=861534 RepID=UPI0012F8B3F0|nr:arylamine N-acetyltransferase [Sphingomonas formosensis]